MKQRAIMNGARRGSILVAAFLLVAGVVTIVDTLRYSDIDSKVFPRAAAIVLILCAALILATECIRHVRGVMAVGDAFGAGIWWRRTLLITSMLVACVAMPMIGFLPAGAIAFAGALVAAMHERWSIKTALLYGISGAVIMVAFDSLFRHVLHVPLP